MREKFSRIPERLIDRRTALIETEISLGLIALGQELQPHFPLAGTIFESAGIVTGLGGFSTHMIAWGRKK